MARKRRMTDKQRVLRKYPYAYCRNVYGVPTILVGNGPYWETCGTGFDSSSAWSDAARRLK